MTDDRYGYWLQDMRPSHRGPTTSGVARLAVFVLLLVLTFQWFTEGGAAQVDRKPGVSFCEEKGDRPGWVYVCDETRRRSR